MKYRMLYLSILLAINSFSFTPKGNKAIHPSASENSPDSNKVIDLNKKGFECRLSNPERGFAYAMQALRLAKKIRYKNGEAEAYRVMGIAKYYLNESSSSIANYLTALSIYKLTKNRLGQAKVYNNIGNLYIWADYNKALAYFNEALKLSRGLNDNDLNANLHLNIGNIHLRKKNYQTALAYYERGNELYEKTDNKVGIMHCLQNRGKIYLELKQLDRAEEFLLGARAKAKSLKLSGAIASIDLSLSSVYTSKKEFKKAERTLNEGLDLAKQVKDNKLAYDFQYGFYELEAKRKDFKNALNYLKVVYRQDSLNYASSESAKISLMEEQFNERETQRENELINLREKQSRIVLLSTVVVALMSIIMVIVLAINVRRKMKTNAELMELNEKVTIQKERLNEVNQNLEKMIDERTKDLQIKNRKLSEYSAHLSHEIRGPVASMKGLMILEDEQIIEHDELVDKMKTCINSIDDKIHRINEMLNNPDIPHLKGNKED